MPDSSALNEPINTTETTETTETTVVWESWQQERLTMLRLRHEYSRTTTFEQHEMQDRPSCQACQFAGEHGQPDTYVFEGIHHDDLREFTCWARWSFPHARDCPRQEGSA